MRGYERLEDACRQRDHIDAHRQAKQRARAIAEQIFEAGLQILDPLGTVESRQAQASMETASRLLGTYEDPAGIRYDEDDEPYYLVGASNGSGWFVVDRGNPSLWVRHVADPGQDQDRIEVPGGEPGSFLARGSKPAGWGRAHTQAAVDEWVAECAEDYERNVMEVRRWLRQHGRRPGWWSQRS